MSNDLYLLVDDNSFALKELSDIMDYVGYKNIHKAGNADDALTVLKKTPIYCIIASFDMEDMSGLELLKKIRKDIKLGKTPCSCISQQLFGDVFLHPHHVPSPGMLFPWPRMPSQKGDQALLLFEMLQYLRNIHPWMFL